MQNIHKTLANLNDLLKNNTWHSLFVVVLFSVRPTTPLASLIYLWKFSYQSEIITNFN